MIPQKTKFNVEYILSKKVAYYPRKEQHTILVVDVKLPAKSSCFCADRTPSHWRQFLPDFDGALWQPDCKGWLIEQFIVECGILPACCGDGPPAEAISGNIVLDKVAKNSFFLPKRLIIVFRHISPRQLLSVDPISLLFPNHVWFGLVWFGFYAWTLGMYAAAGTYQNSRLRATVALEFAGIETANRLVL